MSKRKKQGFPGKAKVTPVRASNATCPRCGRPSDPGPLAPEKAAMFCIAAISSGIENGDRHAYCYARSTVMLSTMNANMVCECDQRNWQKAAAEYERDGGELCWYRIGMTAEIMDLADIERLEALTKERPLSDAERVQLEGLKKLQESIDGARTNLLESYAGLIKAHGERWKGVDIGASPAAAQTMRSALRDLQYMAIRTLLEASEDDGTESDVGAYVHEMVQRELDQALAWYARETAGESEAEAD